MISIIKPTPSFIDPYSSYPTLPTVHQGFVYILLLDDIKYIRNLNDGYILLSSIINSNHIKTSIEEVINNPYFIKLIQTLQKEFDERTIVKMNYTSDIPIEYTGAYIHPFAINYIEFYLRPLIFLVKLPLFKLMVTIPHFETNMKYDYYRFNNYFFIRRTDDGYISVDSILKEFDSQLTPKQILKLDSISECITYYEKQFPNIVFYYHHVKTDDKTKKGYYIHPNLVSLIVSFLSPLILIETTTYYLNL